MAGPYLLATTVELEGRQHTDGLLVCQLAQLLVGGVDLDKGDAGVLLLHIQQTLHLTRDFCLLWGHACAADKAWQCRQKQTTRRLSFHAGPYLQLLHEG